MDGPCGLSPDDPPAGWYSGQLRSRRRVIVENLDPTVLPAAIGANVSAYEALSAAYKQMTRAVWCGRDRESFGLGESGRRDGPAHHTRPTRPRWNRF